MILKPLLLLVLWAAAPRFVAGSTQQKPLRPAAVSDESNTVKLHGRFLHITDFHPDPFYTRFSSTDDEDACHWGKGDAGIFGAENTDCDTPITLVNASFQWINDHLKDSIDFVIWTGDSARHDNDELIPRSEKQIIYLNELLVNKFVEVFGKEDNVNDTDPTNDFTIPIVPNFGNNDILPHNIFTQGPNRWTKTFAHLWRKFIPEEQTHVFERGGWFFVEVIPDKLAVFSLNTLYFFSSNTAVNGCAEKSEPGYEHFEWLRIQLQFLRERGMKAILTGHVPPARTPSKQSWDETCWQKYTLWLQQYRDVVIGGLYGHMNIDHFVLQDHDRIDMSTITGEVEPKRGLPKSNDFSTQSSAEYLTELRYEWSELPDTKEAKELDDRSEVWPPLEASRNKKRKKNRKTKHDKLLDKIGGPWGERYSATLISASVIPNYFPTMRVFEYNTTGAERISSNTQTQEEATVPSSLDEAKKHGKSKGSQKHDSDIPKPPSKASPPGPAYSSQSLSLLSYTQYFANLTKINAAFASPEKSIKPNFTYEVEYDTKMDTIYGLSDLTVRSYIDLAARIGKYKPDEDDLLLGFEGRGGNVSAAKKKKHNRKKQYRKQDNSKVWFTFVNRAYAGAKDEDDIRDQFGFILED
ncbi:MAG: hypothetical protein Q9201_006038 [Fulgogasparrea decipioides]